MTQSGKQTGKSFLQKFQGKTSKVGKLGIQQTLVQNKQIQSQEQNHQKAHLKKVDLDSIIPSNPQKKRTQKSVRTRGNMNKPLNTTGSKPQYVPSSFTPQQNSAKDQSFTGLPPSRGLSLSTENSRGKYFFGKFLKLDKQALGHIQFLHSIQQKRSFVRQNNSISQRSSQHK